MVTPEPGTQDLAERAARAMPDGTERPESPRGNPTGVTPSPEGAERGSNALSPDSGALPDVRLWPDGTVSVHGEGGTVVMVSRSSSGRVSPWWVTDHRELPDGRAERLIPVGPLLELAKQWEAAGQTAGCGAWIRSGDCCHRCWRRLPWVIRSLLRSRDDGLRVAGLQLAAAWFVGHRRDSQPRRRCA